MVSYEDYDGDADITIISGIDSEYEEIETTQCRVCGPNDKQMLLIDATRLTPEKVLEYVKTIRC
ncbi:MAG: hypothetical protein PWQ37_1420 [Candidatus Petromonas sp.]|nr:hypothetical protein [Candidatus Petromonas sp.]